VAELGSRDLVAEQLELHVDACEGAQLGEDVLGAETRRQRRSDLLALPGAS